MASFDFDECDECVIIRELMSAIDSKTDALPFNDKRDNGGGGCVGNARRGKPKRSIASDGHSVDAIVVDSMHAMRKKERDDGDTAAPFGHSIQSSVCVCV